MQDTNKESNEEENTSNGQDDDATKTKSKQVYFVFQMHRGVQPSLQIGDAADEFERTWTYHVAGQTFWLCSRS